MKRWKARSSDRTTASWLPLLSLAAAACIFAAGVVGFSAPRYGGGVTVTWTEPMSLTTPAENLLPSERAFSSLTFETLFKASPDGPRPVLVETWEANGDSTEWIVALKSNVRFHNGKVLSADDVVYSFHRILNSEEPSPYKWPLRNLAAVVPAAEDAPESNSPGSRTIKFSFKEPEPLLPELLSCPGLAVLPLGFSGPEPESGPFEDLPPGTGPFRVERADAPARIELVANEAHHLGRPFLDSVTWRFEPFEEALVDFRAGIAVSLAGIPSPVAGVQASLQPGTLRFVYESAYTVYLGCNPSRSGLRSSQKRREVMAAVNRPSMLTSIVGESGRLARSLLAGDSAGPLPWRPDAGGIRRDSSGDNDTGTAGSEGQRRDSGELGQTELTLLVPRWHGLISEIGDRIQVDLMAAGYEVRLRKVGREEFAFKVTEGDFDLFLGLWAPDIWRKDADWLLNDFRETQLSPVPPLASALALAAGGSTSGLEATLAEEALLLPLFHMDLVFLVRDLLIGAEPGKGGPPDLAWSWLRAGGR